MDRPTNNQPCERMFDRLQNERSVRLGGISVSSVSNLLTINLINNLLSTWNRQVHMRAQGP